MSAFRAVISASLERTIDQLCDDLERAKEAYRSIDIGVMNDDELLTVDSKFRKVYGDLNFYATDAQAIAGKMIDRKAEDEDAS
jgi:hypothetical protein